MNDVTSDGYTGRANETTGADDFNAITFLINQVMSGNWTLTLAQVKSVTGGGVGAPPIVDVQPMVNQIDGFGNPTPHGIINDIPVFRLQGGAGAFIADPVVGSMGILACASRDISSVKKNRAVSNPGSRRTFDPSDGMFLGELFGATPENYFQIDSDGNINVVSATKITFTVGGTSLVISDGSVTIAGIDFASHLHSGVQTGGGESGPPV